MRKTSAVNVIIGGLYLVLLIALGTGLWLSRRQVLHADDPTKAQGHWEEWRSEAERQQAGGGPVKRRVPPSEEPPTLVLLRDHFLTSATVLIVISSALYFSFALMIRGALTGPRFVPNLEDDPVFPANRRESTGAVLDADE